MPSLARRTVSNAGWAGTCRVLTGVVSLATVPVFIGRLGAASYGIYVLIQSLLGVTGLFNLGFGEAAIKYTAEADGRGDTASMARYFRNVLAVSLVVTAAVFGLVVLCAGILADTLLRASPDQREVAVASLFWFGLAWVGRNINGALATLPAARQRYDQIVLIREGAVVLERVLALAVLGFGGGLVDVFQVQIVPQIVAGILFAAAARRALPGVSLVPRFDAACLARSFRFILRGDPGNHERYLGHPDRTRFRPGPDLQLPAGSARGGARELRVHDRQLVARSDRNARLRTARLVRPAVPAVMARRRSRPGGACGTSYEPGRTDSSGCGGSPGVLPGRNGADGMERQDRAG